MRYSATIQASGDAALIQKVFASEDTNIKEKANYKLKKAPGGVAFTIQAEDSTSLRTALNSITKILTVIEKMKSI